MKAKGYRRKARGLWLAVMLGLPHVVDDSSTDSINAGCERLTNSLTYIPEGTHGVGMKLNFLHLFFSWFRAIPSSLDIPLFIHKEA